MMIKGSDKDKFVIKKKYIPSFLSAISLILAIVWIGVVFSGVLKEFDSESLKSLTGKRIVFSLSEENSDQDTGKVLPQSVIPEERYNFVSVLIEPSDYSNIDKISNILPAGITLGLSSVNNVDFEHLKSKLNNLRNDYLIKLPLINKISHRPYDIYPHIDQVALDEKLTLLLGQSKSAGVYNIGNEEFLEADLPSFANVISNLSKKNMFLLYGIRDETTVFESDSENIFTVEACDSTIDVSVDNTEQITYKLNKFEEIATDKGKGVIFIKVMNENIPDNLLNWLSNLEDKKIRIVPFNQLPKTLRN